MIVSASTAVPFAATGSSTLAAQAQARARATASPQVVEAEVVPVGAEITTGPEIMVRMREAQSEASPKRMVTYGPDGKGRPSYGSLPGQVLRVTV